MNIFISYIILGLSLAAPIGPINAAQLDKGIRNGFWHSWLVGVGAMLADVVYMVLVFLGVGYFLNTPIVQTFLWLFGCFILLYTGIESIISARIINRSSSRGEETLARCFYSGFFMSLSNPLTILFWLGIYGSVLAKTAASAGTERLLIYSAAIIIGLLLWDLTMATLASSFRKVLNTSMLTLISIASGLSLIGFGLYFGVEAFKILFL